MTRNLRTQNIYKIEQPGLKTIGLGSGCVAQLVERSLQIPEVRGSNPVIGKILLNICLLSTVYWNDENKEKEAGNGPFKKNYWEVGQWVTSDTIDPRFNSQLTF